MYRPFTHMKKIIFIDLLQVTQCSSGKNRKWVSVYKIRQFDNLYTKKVNYTNPARLLPLRKARLPLIWIGKWSGWVNTIKIKFPE